MQMETVCMKCQSLVSGGIKKKNINVLSAELAEVVTQFKMFACKIVQCI